MAMSMNIRFNVLAWPLQLYDDLNVVNENMYIINSRILLSVENKYTIPCEVRKNTVTAPSNVSPELRRQCFFEISISVDYRLASETIPKIKRPFKIS